MLKKKIIKISASAFVGLLLLITIANAWVIESTTDRVYTDFQQLPERSIALILGTSNKLTNGSENPFFNARIEMGKQLIDAGKVQHLLVSGDNRSKYYNEPQKMLEALINLGVPADKVTLDYAGFRTLDSIVRCKEIFGEDEIIIITQQFHCYRAIFLSQYYGIDAIAMATKPLPKKIEFNTIVREIFARTKAIWDTYVVNKSPKYLGDKEYIF